MNLLFRLALWIVFGYVLTSTAFAQYTPEQLQRHFQSTAEAYEMMMGTQPLELRKQSLMNWRNPERQQDQGAMYVWERGGRPEVLGSIFTYEYNGKVFCRHEMLSLAASPIVSKLDSQTVWNPQTAALKWIDGGNDVVPAESSARRLIQMRSLSREFSATLSIPDKQPSKLTLIPQPLVRYQSESQGIIDGAVFSYAVGTDPEVLVVIEARKSSDGSPRFYFAPARSHYHAVTLERGGRVVWSAPMDIALEMTRAGQTPYSRQPFFVMTPKDSLPSPEALK